MNVSLSERISSISSSEYPCPFNFPRRPYAKSFSRLSDSRLYTNFSYKKLTILIENSMLTNKTDHFASNLNSFTLRGKKCR